MASLHPDTGTPLRPPGYHPSAVVAELAEAIERAWEECLTREPLPDGDWLAFEIDPLLRVFRHAAAAGECIVEARAGPASRPRASESGAATMVLHGGMPDRAASGPGRCACRIGSTALREPTLDMENGQA